MAQMLQLHSHTVTSDGASTSNVTARQWQEPECVTSAGASDVAAAVGVAAGVATGAATASLAAAGAVAAAAAAAAMLAVVVDYWEGEANELSALTKWD